MKSVIQGLAIAMFGLCGTLAGIAGAEEGVAQPRVYFIAPLDGEQVSNPVTVKFGLQNMGVAPAGVERANTGHHHLLIDAALPPLDAPIPADEHHRHFGGGQTETTVELAPGVHRLQLLLGDYSHIPQHPPVMSDVITIEVQ